jgi:hypothetical protein
MSGLIPRATVDIFRDFSDLSVELYGIGCTIYVPTNLTSLDPNDAYTSPSDITYKEYLKQKVWIKWAVKDLHRLRKLGIFSENEAPIIAYFKNVPEVIMQSYIKVDIRYIPNNFDTDEFEVVDIIMKGTYDSEILRPYKLAPRRAKNK